MSLFRKLFKKRDRIIFFMKSGNQFYIEASNVTISRNNETGECIGYEIDNLGLAAPVFINVGQIEAVVKVL